MFPILTRPLLIALTGLCALAGAPQDAAAQRKVSFGTDWRAQAEHGGFYQALAKGFYAAHGLDVSLRQGGPQINHAQLLSAGRVDFSLSSNSFIVLNYTRERIPMVAVAALFQKDPAVLIAHPNQGNDSFEALRGKPIFIGSDTRVGSWNFLKAKYDYQSSQIRPYSFNIAPFLTNPATIQQGYLGSEPYLIEQQGIKPVVLLLADAGYSSYGALIQTSHKMVNEEPTVVQAFVDASIEGSYDYLYGDPAAGNALIKKDNPEMTDALLAYGRSKLIEYGILTSGDAAGAGTGIGAMSNARWEQFFQMMLGEDIYPKEMNITEAYTLQFVNQRVGVERKP